MSFFRRSRSRRTRRQPLRAKRLRFEPLEDRRLLAAYTVTSAANDGAGSLREAIAAVNAGTYDAIDFAGSYTINLIAELEAITQDDITIDGGANTIVLNGAGAGSGANGLTIQASGSTIANLTIQYFAGAGVRIDGAASSDADNNRVEDNLITNNGVGVTIVGDSTKRDTANLELKLLVAPVLSIPVVNSTATGNTVTENTITGNAAQGVLIQHASENIVSANTIGDNGAAGVKIEGTGDALVETFDGDPDQPELNPWETYAISNSATGNVIVGNWIGIDASDTNLSNAGDGILIDGASYNIVGGTSSSDRNVISYNTKSGIRVTGLAEYQPPSSLLSSLSSGGGMAQRRQAFEAAMAAVVANLDDSGPRQSPLESVETTMQEWTGAVAVYNRIQSNFIGADTDGDAAAGNADYGVLVEKGARVTIIGAEAFEETPAGGNLIVANTDGGVKIVGDPLNEHLIVEPDNNYLPTPSDEDPQELYSLGTQPFENNDPIVEVFPTLVAGNWIGITSDDVVLGNLGDGVLVEDSRAVVIQNTISGNGDDETTANGVQITGTPLVGAVFGNLISANKIGTKTDGTVSLNGQGQVAQGNWGDGVLLDDGVQFTIVGAPFDEQGDREQAELFRNVVSGNRGWGVHVSGLVLPGQQRGIFHAELAHDPFLFPTELRVDIDPDPDQEEWVVKPYGTVSNYVYANYVGVDGSGAAAAANGQGGVLVDDAAAFTEIGKWNVPLAGQFYSNVISGNDGPGVSITGQGTSVTVVGGNLIGLTANGQTALGNDGPGVQVTNGALATNIGGDVYAASLGSRNYIAGNNGPGILIQEAYDFRRAVITDPDPGQEIGDPIGELTDPITGVINTAAWDAAIRDGSNYYSTAVVSNWIGLGVQIGYDLNGVPISHAPIAIGNQGDGIEIVDSSNTMIGANHPAWGRNTISANAGNGISITGAKSFLTFIQQDFIGTDDAGEAAAGFGNAENGVLIDAGAHHNVISGTGPGLGLFTGVLTNAGGDLGEFDPTPILLSWNAAELGNVISGNVGAGIRLDDADYNRIAGGNFIGVNFGATTAVPNQGSGVLMTAGSSDNIITPSVRPDAKYFADPENPGQEIEAIWGTVVKEDVISGNLGAGVTIEGAGSDENSIQGALIGVGFSAGSMIGLGNGGPGVLIRDGAMENLIDEGTLTTRTEPANVNDFNLVSVTRRNVIVANGTTATPRAGVEITGASTKKNKVFNSYIGTNELGATNLGNTGDGVLVTASASQNLIGDAGAGNTIAKNGRSGVAIRGKNQVIEGWDVDGNGYLLLTLASLDGIEANKTYNVRGFALYDEEENAQAVESVTVVSIDVPNLTIQTNVLVTLTGTLDADFSEASYVEIAKPKLNVVAGNWIGTDAGESDLGNLGDGVLVTASAAENWVTTNEISFNGGHGVALTAGALKNDVGIRVVNNITSGGANTVTYNALNGVLISGSAENSVWDNLIAHNVQHGVEIRDTKNTRKNSVLGNTITQNSGYGVLIANGAEGNGIGVHIGESPAPYQRPIAIDATAGNTITGNEGGFQVRIEGSSAARTQYNFVSGYNEIEGYDGASAVSIDGGEGNVVGNGGEGQNPGGDYIVGDNPLAYQNGNVIAYDGENAYGVEISGDGGEGNAVIGNAFVGDLDNAILIEGYTGIDRPTIDGVTVGGAAGEFALDIEATVALASSTSHVRVDYYLVNPNDFTETYVLGSHIFDSDQPWIEPFDVEVDPSFDNLEGWYVTATATYKLQGNDNLSAGSITSTLAVYPIT